MAKPRRINRSLRRKGFYTMRYDPVLKSCCQCVLRHHKSAAIFFIFALFFILFFHKGIITGTFYTIGDQFVYLHPLRREAWRLIREGALPLWNPYIFSGYPLFAESQLGLAYPLTWGYIFLSGPWAEQINVLAPFLLAPIFTYLFVRALGKSRPAGIIAGFCFGYGGFMAIFFFKQKTAYEMVWVANNVGCGLVNMTPDGKFVPDAAESWQISPDGLLY